MRRLIVSDTHIGSKFCKKDYLLELLKENDYDQIILNGDIIELLKAPSFTPIVIEIANRISESKEIIYVIGNHDVSLSGFIGKVFGKVKFVKEYCFEEGGRKFRVEHGDKYEKGIIHKKILMKFISAVQDVLENVFNLNLSLWYSKLKFNRRKVKRLWDMMELNSDVDVLIVGHTHIPEVLIWIDEEENIKTYVNTGDWVSNATYVEIENGVLRLKNFLKRKRLTHKV